MAAKKQPLTRWTHACRLSKKNMEKKPKSKLVVTIPTNPITNEEPQDVFIDVSKLHEVHRLVDFEALGLWKGQSDCSTPVLQAILISDVSNNLDWPFHRSRASKLFDPRTKTKFWNVNRWLQCYQMFGQEAARRTLSQFQSLKIRRSANFM